MDELIAELLAVPGVRYVAVRRDGRVTMREKRGLAGASSAESDRYEEAIVNPTLITLLTTRGAIGCGGFEYALIRYGNFLQLVSPIDGGHVSVALEPEAVPLEAVAALRATIAGRTS